MKKVALISLERATVEACHGAKAMNLARLLNAGVTTAPGTVLGMEVLWGHLKRLGLADRAATFLSALNAAEVGEADLRAEAEWLRRSILESRPPPELMDALAAELEPGVTYAVRSSAHGEDQADASFAGQFDSVLGCRSVEAVARAVCTVWASLFGERAVSYSLYCERHPQGMAVIIQRQVEAVVSGVMFTRDPRNAAGEELLVEYCAGLGERLVSGQVSPGRLRIHRQDRSFVEEAIPDDPVAWNPASAEARATLCQLALKLEKIFQCPQDVEWSVDQVGQLYVLQARPITASAGSPDDVVWTNANIAENFPEPICPLLRSFVGQGYAAYFRGLGVAFGISERRLAAMGQALDNLVGCHGGRLYYNLSNIHTVLHLAPGGPLLARYFNQFTGAQEFPAPKRNPRSRMVQVPEILWVSVRVAWCYLHVQRGLRAFEQRVDAFASTSEPNALAALSLQQLVDLMRAFLEIRLERWTGAALADTAAMVCYGVLTALLRGQAGVDANDLLKGLPGLASAEPVERLWDLSREVRRDNALSALISESSAETVLERLHEGQHPTFHNALSTYIDTWGFRSSGELMLSRPTPQEDPLPVLRLLKTYVAMGGEGPAEVSWRQAAARASATRQARRRLGPWRGAIFGLILRATQGSILLRERARMKQALLYTRLRHVALSLGQLLVAKGLLSQPDDVLYLSMEEAISLAEGTETRTGGACQRVRDRRAEISACRTWSPPDSFALPEGETWSAGIATESQEAATSTEMLTGVAACGGRARGHAAVVLNVTEIDRICEDQILVTRQTDPGWASVFFMVQGLVIERGGMLSHGAIIAREYGIPAVIGVRDATRLIGDGDFLFVDGDKGCVQFVCD